MQNTPGAAEPPGRPDPPGPPDSSQAHLLQRTALLSARAGELLRGIPPTAPLPDDSAVVAQALGLGVELRLPGLATTFALPKLALELLLCFLAAELEPALRTLARAVQREPSHGWLEVATAFELLALPRSRVPEALTLLAADAGLLRHALLLGDPLDERTPVVSRRLRASPRLLRYLLEDDQLAPPLALHPQPAALAAAPASLPAAPLHGIALRARLAQAASAPLVIAIAAPAESARREGALALAAALEQPLLTLDLSLVEPALLGAALLDLRREATLYRALPGVMNLDPHLPAAAVEAADAAGAPLPKTLRRLPKDLARFLESTPSILCLTLEEHEPLLLSCSQDLCQLDVPFPSPSQRAQVLSAALSRRGATLGPEVDLAGIARRFALDADRLELAARAAVDLARQRDSAASSSPRIGREELSRACQGLLRHDLKTLATRVTASHRWEDLVATEEVLIGLTEMISYVRHAAQVYDAWGFAARHSLSGGLSALFTGPPGTGKTMCASVMARELDMELFRVDLSRVVSKWIGETEKNLSRVFDEAQRSGAIILFDEADALFAKRTDVKTSVDRYANLEVNFLLQRMETFSGVTILTTNFEDTLDAAFKRRLTFRLRFEKPDAEARALLWQRAFPERCAVAEDVDPQLLGERFDLSGGNIRNAALRSAFLAAEEGLPVSMAHCLAAAEREARELGQLVAQRKRRRALDEEDDGWR